MNKKRSKYLTIWRGNSNIPIRMRQVEMNLSTFLDLFINFLIVAMVMSGITDTIRTNFSYIAYISTVYQFINYSGFHSVVGFEKDSKLFYSQTDLASRWYSLQMPSIIGSIVIH